METVALSRAVKSRLAVMMFLQYFTAGATWPVMSLYLKDCLHFSGFQTGVTLAMSCAAGVVSPWVGACVADRVISAERLLVVCHFAAAGLMLALSTQKALMPVLLLYLAYTRRSGGLRPMPGVRPQPWSTLGSVATAWPTPCFLSRCTWSSTAIATANREPVCINCSRS